MLCKLQIVKPTIETTIVIKRKKPQCIPNKMSRSFLLENGFFKIMVIRITIKKGKTDAKK